MSHHDELAPVRPAAWAELLLASGDLLPRQRARDQQADLAGMALKRHMLNRLLALDPAPAQMEQALEQCISEAGQPQGPARAIALGLLDEWQAACLAPDYMRWLLEQALLESDGPRERKRRARPQESD